MSVMNMIRGQKAKLVDLTPSQQIEVAVTVAPGSGQQIDISCFGLDANGKLSDDRYFIFYNQKVSPCGFLAACGTGSGTSEVFRIDVSRLPQTIKRLVFTATLEGTGTLSSLGASHLQVRANGEQRATFAFSGKDFGAERALMIAELYHKDVWRLAANGQGFNGGLSALLAHFGGQELSDSVSPSTVPTPASSTPGKLCLEKRVEREAPQLASLARTMQVTLEKRKLLDVVAKVAIVLDASYSMQDQYNHGHVQSALERLLMVALQLDDDGELELWAYADSFKKYENVSLANYRDYVRKLRPRWKLGDEMSILGLGFGNDEPPVMRDVVSAYASGPLPALVIFITDGGISASKEIESILRLASKHPIFWQFIGLGGSDYGVLEHLDTMQGRLVDNVNFFAIDDYAVITDTQLYERLLGEFPSWLKEATAKGIIGN